MSEQTLPVIIFGAGGVGRALLEQIVAGRETVAARNRLRFRVVAVADSRRWLWSPDGLSDEQLLDIIAAKKNRRKVGDERPDSAEIVSRAHAAGLERGILVDVTAQDGMEPTLNHALDLDWGVVLANKKPLAGPWESARRFFEHPFLRHESTVGGGQPVIATLRYLLDTSDPIFRIEGQLSGTLGYICRRLDEQVPFSRAIAEAKAFGYTEPDPREDLGGRDVMRKMMILARMAGWALESADIQVESLYHHAQAHLSVPEFMASAVALDPSMGDRVAAAAAAGNALRYVAEVTPEGGSVGLKPVAQSSPLANLKYVSFETERYRDEPLMIGGKGAGVQMTAAGVHGDMIDLGREM
jgi:homoserine dehydrogenase